jgi:BirA family biotin operon repressor/biotin-[acetyl-CoA-carboxylase] ligase
VAPVVHRLERIASTQDVLHHLAAAGAAAGTAVTAREQTGGRGSRGRGWTSPIGGLWMSVLLRPAVAPALEVLSLRVALVVSAAIEAVFPGVVVQLKWPNDLVLAGRKLGGILCEARWQGSNLGWVAVGTGVNVANPVPVLPGAGAIALTALVPAARPEVLVEPIAAAIATQGDRQGYLSEAELTDYRARDWLAGKRLREPVPGTAGGVGRDGALLLRGDNGVIREVRSGSVLTVDD